jgi:hypothetical protein
MHLLAQPIACGDWPGQVPTLDEESAKQGRYAHASVLLLESDDRARVDLSGCVP